MTQSFRSPSKMARRLKLTPLAALGLSSWPAFMGNYVIGRVPERAYRFRNGARVAIGRGVDHVPIIEIFLRKDYGAMPEDATIVDLGANIGVFSVYAGTTSPDARVYAYEPDRAFYELLTRNVAMNELGDRISCHNVAVADTASERELFGPTADFFFPTLVASSTAAGDSTTVACTTLGHIISDNELERIDLLKLDIEGAEYEVLYGASAEDLARVREIRMEYHDLDGHNRNVATLRDFLQEHGFTITRASSTSSTHGNLWAARHD